MVVLTPYRPVVTQRSRHRKLLLAIYGNRYQIYPIKYSVEMLIVQVIRRF